MDIFSMVAGALISGLVGWYFYRLSSRDLEKVTERLREVAILLFSEISQITGRKGKLKLDEKTGNLNKHAYGGAEVTVGVHAEGSGIRSSEEKTTDKA